MISCPVLVKFSHGDSKITEHDSVVHKSARANDGERAGGSVKCFGICMSMEIRANADGR